MFERNEYGKVEGRSLVEVLWGEVGTELGPCDGMSDGRYFVKLEGSVMGESLVSESGTEIGSSSEM